MTRFSVVIPVHNEETFLRYSLPSVYALKPSEVLLLFDRCSNGSRKVAKEIACRHNASAFTSFVVDEPSDFGLRFAFLRNMGCFLARNNVVLVSAADLVLDPKIGDYVDLVGEYGLITFEHTEYPVNWRQLVKRLLARVLPFGWIGGVRLFDRRLLMFEDEEELKRMESGEDTHLANALRKHCRTLYVMSDTVHLRPREDSKTHYLKGKLYAKFGRSFLLTVASAVCMFRLNLLRGYIHERFGS